MNLFTRRKKFKSFGEFPFRIVPAFELGGTTYYEVENIFNTPCFRAMSAIKYYEEMRMKCTLEYLEAWTEGHSNLIKQAKELFQSNGNRLNLAGIFDKLNELDKRSTGLKERLNLAMDIDLVYKLASVVYFDETENPYQYEQQYGHKKIVQWNKSEDVSAFFLRSPIKKLVPFLHGQEENILLYSEVTSRIKEQDLKEVMSNLSSEQKQQYTNRTSLSNALA